MKIIKIPYRGKTIQVTKDMMSYILSTMLILFALFLSGVFNFAKFNFDFVKILTAEFWLIYFLKVGISICFFFAIYIIRKTSNMKKAAILTARQDLKDIYEQLHKAKLVNHMDYWLKYVYNYEKKLAIYKENLLNLYRRSKNNTEKNQKKKEKKELIKKFCEEELKQIENHEALIKAYKTGEDVAVAEAKISKTDNFSSAKSSWRNVYASNLFHNSKNKTNAETIFVNEKKEVAVQLISSIMIMLITTFVITVAALDFANTQSIFSMIVSMITTLSIGMSSSLMALKVADTIYEQYLTAYKNKQKICFMFYEDLDQNDNKEVWAKGDVENQIETNNVNKDVDDNKQDLYD